MNVFGKRFEFMSRVEVSPDHERPDGRQRKLLNHHCERFWTEFQRPVLVNYSL
jgi:hypothetical protein